MAYQYQFVDPLVQHGVLSVTLVASDDAGVYPDIRVDKNFSALVTQEAMDQEALREIARITQEQDDSQSQQQESPNLGADISAQPDVGQLISDYYDQLKGVQDPSEVAGIDQAFIDALKSVIVEADPALDATVSATIGFSLGASSGVVSVKG